MASPSAGSSRQARLPRVAAGAPVDTAHLDRLCEKALTAAKHGRHALAATFFRHAADETLLLHGETFVCTYLTLQRSNELALQLQLQGVPQDEKATLAAQAWELVYNTLPLVVRRMDANTMLPGRGTAVETAFSKRYDKKNNVRLVSVANARVATRRFVNGLRNCSQVLAAYRALATLSNRNVEARAFVLRVMDCMLPAARSLPGFSLPEEFAFASCIQQVLSGALPTYDATFVASLRTKWTAAAMMQMRRERGLLDVSERVEESNKRGETRLRADVAQHGLKRCALPSCDKKEASVQQYKFCSACRSV